MTSTLQVELLQPLPSVLVPQLAVQHQPAQASLLGALLAVPQPSHLQVSLTFCSQAVVSAVCCHVFAATLLAAHHI